MFIVIIASVNFLFRPQKIMLVCHCCCSLPTISLDHFFPSLAFHPTKAAIAMAMEGNDPAVPSAAQTSTLVESLLNFYDDDTASSFTVVITFANSAAASSWTSEDSWFEQLPAAAITTAAAQTRLK